MTITSALVIGNGNYVNLAQLPNPGNDAGAVAAALLKRGIPVTLKIDVTLADLKSVIADFRKKNTPGGTSLFFFSGHGWNLQDRNYIFGVDAPDADALLAGKNLDRILPITDIYDGIAGRMLVLLDTHGDPGAMPDNVVLAYSGSRQHEALDNYILPEGGRSQYSPFTASLIEALTDNHDDLPGAFLDLSQRVGNKTDGQQIPWVSRSIIGTTSWTNQQVMQRPRLVVQTGHFTLTSSVAFSPDGKLVASAGGVDRTAKLWDRATGRELRTLAGHLGAVASVVFSPDGRTLATASSDHTIKLWDVASGWELGTLVGHTDIVMSAVFSPDGKTLASGSNDKTIKLWDLASLRDLRTLTGHTDRISSVTFSPDGKQLASGSVDKTVKLWDAATGRELLTLTGHSDPVWSVAFSPDGKTLASASYDKTIRLWDAASGHYLRSCVGHKNGVRSVAFSPDGRTLASGSLDGTVRIWDRSTGMQLHSQHLVDDKYKIWSVAFSPDGGTLASTNGAGVDLWDVADLRQTGSLQGHSGRAWSVSMSPSGKILAVANFGNDHVVNLWDMAAGRELHPLAGHTHEVTAVGFSADGRTLASGSWDTTIKLWDLASGRELRTLPIGRGHSILSVAISPDGKTVASAGGDNAIMLSDASGNGSHALTGHTDGIFSVAFSPDGRTLASGSNDKTIRLWDLANGRELHTLTGHRAAVTSVAFAADGKTLASGSEDTTVKLWDVGSGQELHTFQSGISRRSENIGQPGDTMSLRQFGDRVEGIWSVALSPDGRILASGSTDRTVKLWDVASGRELRTLGGHQDRVNSVVFSPDGKTLASASDDKTVKLWRVADGASLASLTSFDDGSWAVTDAAGRFDDSRAGNNPNLHWVVGMTPVALDQLKDRYYEPGLLAKIMGYNAEPLRTVPRLQDAFAHLYPAVQAQLDAARPLQIDVTLRDQGGGYGKVRVRLNGKEITPDARDGRRLKDSSEVLTVRVPAGSLKLSDNVVDVVAWNADGNLSSPPASVKLDGTRGAKAVVAAQAATAPPPTLHAIVMGVAHYRDPSMNLTFSGKDAHDFAQAIRLGADRLFGADKVRLHLLTDYQETGPAAGAGGAGLSAQAPTRENLQGAFAQVAREAKPEDILVVFLAGHGVMSGGEDADYYYMTSDADGVDLTDPSVRKLWGVSSAELTEWIKQIRANKQMMVLDTCASGGALEKLTSKRAVPSSQIIALDRLKDRTGFYVLAGAAADRVSYETTRFGQGLLTRALLTGIKGAALRDGEFVDVARLFQYTRDEVPKLAQEIGGIQAPLLAAPNGDSFDVGQMLEEDQRSVPLAAVREMMVQSVFEDQEQMADVVRLSARFNQRLRAENAVSARGQLAYVDTDDFPDAWRLAGRYHQTPQGLQVTAKLFRSTELKGSLQLTLTGDPSEQVEQLFAAVMQRVSQSSH